jgi:GTP-binding protein LepA
MLKALIFDSLYDKHRGVVAYIRLFDGILKAEDTIYMLASNTKATCQEVGFFRPEMTSTDKISSGEVGYLVTGLKDISKVLVGDTVCSNPDQSNALVGYKAVEPKVFANIFTTSQDDYPKLKDSIAKLKLNDASLVYEPENAVMLGFGFRCGFLGLLHLDIVKERLEREFNLDLIVTTPTVEYQVQTRHGHNNENFLDEGKSRQTQFDLLKQEITADLTTTDLKRLINELD